MVGRIHEGRLVVCSSAQQKIRCSDDHLIVRAVHPHHFEYQVFGIHSTYRTNQEHRVKGAMVPTLDKAVPNWRQSRAGQFIKSLKRLVQLGGLEPPTS